MLRPNEAAFRKALEIGGRIGLMVTFEPSAASLEAELRSMAAAAGKEIEVRTVLASGALDALKQGNGDLHDRLTVRAASAIPANCDCLVLGQFSLARARERMIEDGFPQPVITTPDAAVQELRELIAEQDAEAPGIRSSS